MSICTSGASLGTPCGQEATMAVRTTSNVKGLVTTVYWDDSDAPRTAQRLCSQHGADLLSAMARTVASA